MKAARSFIGCTAAVAALGIGFSVFAVVPAPAHAADSAPSWADVQAAKASQAATQSQVNALTKDLQALQDSANKAAMSESQAGQAYSLAASRQGQAQAALDDLDQQARAAKKKADVSAGQVASLVVELSRTGGGDLSATMLTDASDAKDLLYRVSTMSHLSERQAGILAVAESDQRQVSSLESQAKAANAALRDAAEKSKSTLAAANDAVSNASAQLTAAQTQQSTLFAQLAYLKNTTAAKEQQYFEAQQAQQAQNTITTVSTVTPTKTGGSASGSGSAGSGSSGGTAPAPSGGGSSGGGSSSGSGGGTTGGSGGGTTSGNPAPVVSAPPTTTTPPTSGGSGGGSGSSSGGSPSAPTGGGGSTSAAAGAIAYARSKIGDPYIFDAAGPNSFDCSGLVMAAYASQGVAVGGHNVVWQYNYFASLGRLVPLSQARPGDILFYSSDGSVSGEYHDTIYSGSGMMIEAPHPGADVREVPIWWPNELMPYVARPTGSV